MTQHSLNINVNESFDKTDFVKHYWQKKPCVIRQFIKHFEDPIDEHDLAGLAQEEGVDCRLISKQNNTWSVNTGPIADFENICVGDWTLLVQGVDRYIPEIEALSELIDFIPKWRMDDVMVSYSVAQAGVGAHIDEYDVFIIQGKGSRHWQVGLPNEFKNIIPHPLLKQIDDFTPVIDEVLQPGDAVYIPPKHPHNGIALAPCLNYSIGFRAPTNVELLSHIVEEDVFTQENIERYTDDYSDALKQLTNQKENNKYEVQSAEIGRLKNLLKKLIDDSKSTHAILRVLSRQQLPLESLDSEYQYSVQDVIDLHSQSTLIERAPGLKPLYFADNDPEIEFVFCIEGDEFCVTQDLREQTIILVTNSTYSLNNTVLATMQNKHEWLMLISQLLNAGLWLTPDFEDNE